MIVLDVVGLPAPQGSKTAFRSGNRTVMVDGTSATGRANLKAWRDSVRQAAQDWLAEHPRSPIDEPISMTLVFRFPLPASDPHRHWHCVAPDIDKLERSTADALKHAGLLRDDAIICQVTKFKRYARNDEPIGCRITVRSLADDEAQRRQASKEAARVARKSAKAADSTQTTLLT